jgi:hypothetical protein
MPNTSAVYNFTIIKFCILKRTTTFAAYLVPATSGIKREVRCDSGAIPVAVSSFREIFHDRPVGSSNHCSGVRDGKVSKQRASQKTCHVQTDYSRLSGEKHGM